LSPGKTPRMSCKRYVLNLLLRWVSFCCIRLLASRQACTQQQVKIPKEEVLALSLPFITSTAGHLKFFNFFK